MGALRDKGFQQVGGLLCWPLSLALQYEGTGRAIRLLVALLVAAGTPGLAHRPARVQVTVASDQDRELFSLSETLPGPC